MSGQVQGRLCVRESDLIETMVGEGAFQGVEMGEEVVEVWVPSEMLPDWAEKIGKKA